MKVLTSKGGEFSISDDLRGMIAYLEDGRLMVSKTHIHNPHVRGFMARLRHLGQNFTVQQAELSVIAGFYAQSATSQDRSNMQIAAKSLFERAVELRASDIHIRVFTKSPTQIFFRMDNDLEFVEEHPFDYGDQLCTTMYQAMTDISDASFETLSRQDARISSAAHLPQGLDGIRIATTPQVDGFLVVLRLLYNDNIDDLDLVNLGFDQTQVDAIDVMKKRPTGVIVIGGPTGSGKSTTLQRTLSAIIQETGGKKHIITVEDPPEYPIRGATQTPVTNADSEEERSKEYQKAIKATMRLDPDIIMLSEVRDSPTARLAIQAAMTGHQVWTTLHANSALATIDRLMDLGIPEMLLTDPGVVAGLMCQRLVKRLCPHCKRPLSEHAHELDSRDADRFARVLRFETAYILGPGCNHCRGKGTVGRTVVAETIVTNERLMGYLRAHDRAGAISYVRKELGLMSMHDHAILKVNAGIVDPFEAESIVGMLASATPDLVEA